MSLDWYPWYILDYRKDTLRLTLAEDGAYRRLIDEYMLQRGPLPDDDVSLARLLGVGLGDWLNVARSVRRFFRPKDGLLFNKRCDQELRAQNLRSERYRERAQKAAFAKALKHRSLAPTRTVELTTIQDISTLSTEREREGREGLSSKKGLHQFPAAELVALSQRNRK